MKMYSKVNNINKGWHLQNCDDCLPVLERDAKNHLMSLIYELYLVIVNYLGENTPTEFGMLEQGKGKAK